MASPDISPNRGNFIQRHAREAVLGFVMGTSAATAAIAGGASIGAYLNTRDIQPAIDQMYNVGSNNFAKIEYLQSRQANEGLRGIILLGVAGMAAASANAARKRIR